MNLKCILLFIYVKLSINDFEKTIGERDVRF
jgi:hypothetical protein